MDPTHLPLQTEPDPSSTKPTSLTIGDGLLPLELDFDWSDVGSPSSKFEKPDPTDPKIFQRYLINLVSFEIFLARSSKISLVLVEFLARSGKILSNLVEILAISDEISKDFGQISSSGEF